MRSRRSTYVLVAAAAALPRLVVVLHERGTITRVNVDKGSDFARTFLSSGTYGFIPGHPSAYTQPLYGFFLVPLYWLFAHSWPVVGIAQIAVAVAVAWLVYEVGRRVLSQRAALVVAIVATLHPYLIWHDVHMNREILDELLAAAAVLLTLLCAERLTVLRGAGLGAVLGLAILGNVRLILLPLVLAAWLLGGRAAVLPLTALVAATAVVVAPWVVRNKVELSCWAVTTDGRALWKANNPATYSLLTHGKWIDATPPIPGAPITPQQAGAYYRSTGRIVSTDECAQMRFYQHRVYRFWRQHPGEKAKLAVVAAGWLWQPSVTKTENRPGTGTSLDTARDFVEPVYMIPLYALALVGLFLLPRRFAWLAVAVLAYQTVFAMIFVGETRYRVPWDFLIAILAGGAVAELAGRRVPALRRLRADP